MIRCTKCQTINPSDAIFCSNCSSFLEWTGVPVDPAEVAAGPAPAVEPEATEVPASAASGDSAEPGSSALEGAASVGGEPAELVGPAVPAEANGESAAPVAVAEPGSDDAEPASLPLPGVAATEREPKPVSAASELPQTADQVREEPAAAEPGPVTASTRSVSPAPALPGATPPEEKAEAVVTSAAEPRAEPVVEPAEEVAAQPPAIRPVARVEEPPPRRPIVHEEQPEARQPTLDIPARPRPQPEPVHTPDEAAPGEVVCRVCGTPNDPSRRFCRRCGKSLAAPVAAAVVTKPPWYRTILRRAPTKQAGQARRVRREDEHEKRGLISRVLPLLLIMVLSFGITSLVVVPGVRNALGGFVTDLRLRFLPQISDVHPITVDGAGVGRNVGTLAVDDNTATFWLADPASGDPTLTAELGTTINLGGLVVHSGSTTESEFTSHRRPKTLELTFPGTDRPAVDVALTDTADPQPTALDVRGIKALEIRVVDWFESAAGGDKLVAVREIEFKERR